MTAAPRAFVHTETGEKLPLPSLSIAKLKPGSKLRRMLAVFASGSALNRFEAERMGDHTLPQTVDALQRRCGLRFTRVTEAVPGYAGGSARCARYSLSPDQRNKASVLLAMGNAHE